MASSTTTSEERSRRGGWTVPRYVLYVHLLAIVLAAAFIYADVYHFELPNVIHALWLPITIATIAPLFICPLAIFVALMRSDADPDKKMGVFMLEILIASVHFLVLLPGFQ